jgi:hypothetical protein
VKQGLRITVVPIVALLLAVSACSKDTTPAPTTTPSVTITTDTFTGTVPLRGSDAKNFSVAKTGTVNVTLTSASPPSTIVMGLAVGIPKDAGCAPLAGATTNTAAGTIVQLAGTVTPGTLCVQVFDLGTQTAPVNYTVTVAHP